MPNCVAYDPAFAYELAVIIQDGIRRMYVDQESIFYYLTVMNEQYAMPPMPEGAARRHPEGAVPVPRRVDARRTAARAQLFGSGAILPEVLKAQEILETKYSVGADVWSVTSYSELYRDGHACERWNLLHPGETPRVPYVTQCLKDAPGVFVAASDYVKALPDSIDRWLPRPVDDARHRRLRPQREPRRACASSSRSTTATSSWRRWPRWPARARSTLSVVQQAIKTHNINPEKANPAIRIR